MGPWGSKHVEVILQYKYLSNSTVRFVGLRIVNWLWTVHGMNDIKFNKVAFPLVYWDAKKWFELNCNYTIQEDIAN
jgi:hypothetical protein